MVPLVEEIKKQEIIDQLTWDDSVNANKIYVDVLDGTVQLKGTVPNLASKLAAERDTILVEGVNRVENYLNIEFPPRTPIPNDSEIADSAAKVLSLDSRIITADVTIEVNKGIVTLYGKVSSFWEKYMTEVLIANLRGVVDIKNDIKVTLMQKIIDADIETDIKNAFKRSTLLDEDKVTVKVKDGTVHLTGIVANYLIKKEAIDIAMHTKGVTEIIHEITIN